MLLDITQFGRRPSAGSPKRVVIGQAMVTSGERYVGGTQAFRRSRIPMGMALALALCACGTPSASRPTPLPRRPPHAHTPAAPGEVRVPELMLCPRDSGTLVPCPAPSASNSR